MQGGPVREGRPPSEESSSSTVAAAATATVAAEDEIPGGADIEVVPICVPLPSSDVARSEAEGAPSSASSATLAAASGAPCVVGTVTILARSSAIVWIGWGVAAADGDDAVARSSLPPMGPLVVSMPRTRYAGMSPVSSSSSGGRSGGGEAACSQLIGGESDEDQMTSWQMASRLSKKIGWPIFVSCSLAAGGGGSVPPPAATSAVGGGDVTSGVGGALGGFGLGGTDAASPLRAAALAEREVGRILLERKRAATVEVVADE